ncbi:MAG: carbonic anhydrase [Acidimicrobiia bacterium]|nr:carbonic anhydrase [Acidimicrobiia bacterium]
MTAEQALTRLLEGNERFRSGRPAAPNRDGRRRADQAGDQTPFAVVLGCADSRVPPEIVFDQGLGDLFVVRVAGNTAADHMTLGSIEFGVRVLQCPLVLVLGHEKCGAVQAAVSARTEEAPPGGHLGALIGPILPVVPAGRDRDRDLDAAVMANVRVQVTHLAEEFPGTRVVGARYALVSGRVDLLA